MPIRGKSKETLSWPEGRRLCRKCKQILPFSDFHKHAACAYGYNTVCKKCRNPISKAQWEALSTVKKILQRLKTKSAMYNIEFNLTIDDIDIPESCPVFGVKLIPGDHDWCPSIDRINPDKGYVKGNIQVISNKANRMKSDATPEELVQFAKWVCVSYE